MAEHFSRRIFYAVRDAYAVRNSILRYAAGRAVRDADEPSFVESYAFTKSQPVTNSDRDGKFCADSNAVPVRLGRLCAGYHSNSDTYADFDYASIVWYGVLSERRLG